MHHHAKVGMYKSSADNEYVNYVYPQEHGNHYGAKMLSINNSLKFCSNNTFEFNVSHYNAKNLENATHTNELIKDNTTYVRIDYKVSGIGSHSCGPELLEKYRFSEKEVNFEFSILKN